MVATYNSSGEFNLDFRPIPDALPPRAYEEEEAVLGGILIDPNAIYRIWHRLKPEHFGISGHKEIYKACCNLARQNKPTDLISVTSYLKDKDKLELVGGKNKLVNLVEYTISAVNIDCHASTIIEKSIRNDIIKGGNETIRLGYDTRLELDEVIETYKRIAESIVELETAKTEDERIKSRHDKLINAIKHIYTTVPSSSERLMRMMYLGKEFNLSIKFLEQLYIKSLVDTCSARLTYKELKELAGSTVREWLQQGLVPVGSSILLGADGGVGKTNFAYTIAKHMICGTNLGDFQGTGEKRRILICQGDEQPTDTAEKLALMGYDEGDIGEYVQYRYGWSFESMSYLIKDINEFKPHLIIFDSLTFGNRFATCTENDTEYARPILEINALLAEHRCSAIFIHHVNQGGGFRGATAIRNAVSEAWLLTPNTNSEATPYDRHLTIDKSRSRSCKKKYKLYFDPYTLEFQFLGEEYQSENDAQDKNARDRVLRFFHEHRNTRYEAEEIGLELHLSLGHARRTLSALAVDGFLSVHRQPGRANLYFLSYGGDGNPPPSPPTPKNLEEVIMGETHDHLNDHLNDHLSNPATATTTDEGDQVITNFAPQKNLEGGEKLRSHDHLPLEALSGKELKGDHSGDHRCDPSVISDQQNSTEVVQFPRCEKQASTEIVQPIQQTLIPEESQMIPKEPLPKIQALEKTCIGDVKVVAQQLDDKAWEFKLMPTELSTGIVLIEKIGKTKPEKKLKQVLEAWLRTLTFEVYKTDTVNVQWVRGKWVESNEHYEPMRKLHIFETADGTRIKVVGHGCDRIRVVR
jgi:replicative DNA helicase